MRVKIAIYFDLIWHSPALTQNSAFWRFEMVDGNPVLVDAKLDLVYAVKSMEKAAKFNNLFS